MPDIDDLTDYGERCGCGHIRSMHHPKACTGTHRVPDTAALPTPVYAPGQAGDAFDLPVNWPQPLPTTLVACGCTVFGRAEPEPSGEGW